MTGCRGDHARHPGIGCVQSILLPCQVEIEFIAVFIKHGKILLNNGALNAGWIIAAVDERRAPGVVPGW